MARANPVWKTLGDSVGGTGVADTDCEVLTLSLDGLSSMSREPPLLAYKFMFSLARILSRHLRKTSGLLVDFLN